MITIIGDTSEELAILQNIIEAGLINTKDKELTLNVTYKLSTGNIILTNLYNHIIGEKVTDSTKKSCENCKNNPPSKKWPCLDCDMRYYDRWESK